MPKKKRIWIVRPSAGDGIPLAEWRDYISHSEIVSPTPGRIGINPFTKETIEFKPIPGSAYIETDAGRSSFEFRRGKLLVSDASEEAMPLVAEIAAALGAVVEVEADDQTPRRK